MKIFIAGYRGMVGSAILKKLAQDPKIQLWVKKKLQNTSNSRFHHGKNHLKYC